MPPFTPQHEIAELERLADDARDEGKYVTDERFLEQSWMFLQCLDPAPKLKLSNLQ